MRKVKTMPKQLDRIQKAKAYHNHPLRKEYEAKKATILSSGNGFWYNCLRVVSTLSYIMIVGYLILFCLFFFDDWNSMPAIIFFGIINLIVAFILFYQLECEGNLKAMKEDRHKEQLKKLENEYSKEGLFELTEQDLFNTKCIDYDDIYECFACGVTGQHIIDFRKVTFCKTPGNCKKCKTFMQAYLGENWDGEYEME